MEPFLFSVLPPLFYAWIRKNHKGYKDILAGTVAALMVAGLFFLGNFVKIINVRWTWIWMILRILIEEASKIAALKFRDHQWEHYLPAIGVGLSFASVEHIFYLTFFPQSIALRLLLTTPLHCLTLLCFIFLYRLLSSFPKGKLLISFTASFLLHTGFNAALNLT